MALLSRTMLKSKIHRATVTHADLNYVGSISIDPELLAAADIAVGEQVHVVDVTNGARLVTYAIAGTRGQICMNGAAAHLVHVGDVIIIISYGEYDASLDGYAPRVVHVDKQNLQFDEQVATELAGGPADNS